MNRRFPFPIGLCTDLGPVFSDIRHKKSLLAMLDNNAWKTKKGAAGASKLQHERSLKGKCPDLR